MSEEGIIIRDKQGRFLPGTKPSNTIKSSASARMLSEKRWSKYRQAAAKGIVKEAMSIDPTVKTPADAWSLVASKQYVALVDSDKPRADDLYRLGQIVGALPLAGEIQSTTNDTGSVTVSMDADTARGLIAQLVNGFDNVNYRKHTDVIDGTATSIDDSNCQDTEQGAAGGGE